MNIFQNKFFNYFLPGCFVFLLLLLFDYGFPGVQDVKTLVVNACLMFLATIIAISLPIYASSKNEQKRRDEELKMIYISASRYIGGEILDNVIEIQDVLKINQKSFNELNENYPSIPDKEKKMVIASIWKAASEILLDSLQDKHHNNMVMSGLVAKIPDDSVGAGVRDTYQKMDNLKKRLQSMSKFLGMILSPQPELPDSFIDYQLNNKLQETINAVEQDIVKFNEAAEITRIEINKLLKPYRKEIKIVYEE